MPAHLDIRDVPDGSAPHGEEHPRAWHALQLVLAPILELDPRSDHEGWDGARDEQLARTGVIDHAGGDMNANTADVSGQQFNLAGV
jgi:hypothetical protein